MGNICIYGVCENVCQPKWEKYDNKTEMFSFKGQKIKCINGIVDYWELILQS